MIFNSEKELIEAMEKERIRKRYDYYKKELLKFGDVVFPNIKKVIFNPPATIVYWDDNSRTVVKKQLGEKFDPEKGLTMAITKKAFGNKGSYFNEIKKWVETYHEEVEAIKKIVVSMDNLKYVATSFIDGSDA